MPSPRPRLLYLSQCLPYPPNSGVTNRSYHILRELQRAFDVSLVAFSRLNHQPDAAARSSARDALAGLLHLVVEPAVVSSERSRASKVAVHLKSVLTGTCYVDHEYASREFGARIADAIARGKPDIVHLDSLDLHRWAGVFPGVPVTCTHHSIESDLLRLRADHHASRFLRPYLRLQARRYEALERRETPRFAQNVMMSEVDAARLRAIAPAARTVCVPNGCDPDDLRPAGEASVDPDLLAFLGPAYMYPNRDGMEYFLERIWPEVLDRHGSARLEWIGRVSSQVRERYERHVGVRCLGFVDDLGSALARPACVVVPLRIGGGTRLKILDAWAAGKAVVSTSVGCEGLECQDGRNILVRDDPGEFAEAVCNVLRDDVLRRHLGAGGRLTVEQRYSWEGIGQAMNRSYLSLLGD